MISRLQISFSELIMHLSYRWENAQNRRYYRLVLSQDLFGDWVVTKVWGKLNTASGRIVHHSCDSYPAALALIDKISKIRSRRGYTLCETP